MIQGIALQMVLAPAGATEGLVPQLRQVMVFPAAKQIWVRSVNDDHPKKPWRKRSAHSYDLSKVTGHFNIEKSLDTTWELRSEADWHLTGDPVGFQITDDEYLADEEGGSMPEERAAEVPEGAGGHRPDRRWARRRPRPRWRSGDSAVLDKIGAAGGITTAEKLGGLPRQDRRRGDGQRCHLAADDHAEGGQGEGCPPHRNENNLPDGKVPQVEAEGSPCPPMVAKTPPPAREGAVQAGTSMSWPLTGRSTSRGRCSPTRRTCRTWSCSRGPTPSP